MPASSWDQQPLDRFLSEPSLADSKKYFEYRLENGPRFFFAPDHLDQYQQHFPKWDTSQTPMSAAEALNRGLMRFFEHDEVQTGFPPDWHANAITGERAPDQIHWSEIGDFDNGDIKIIWEPSRFGFTFSLVRAYWRTGDSRYAEMFWSLVEDWRDRNPPQLGVNWKCGQEIGFRVMAWCFGLYGFLRAESTTAQRVASLAQMIAVSGARINANIDYALSQNNNHGISEATGLLTIASLFPEFDRSAQWKETGRRLLESQAGQLIYDDGAFAQHSSNYHRVMLHDYIWAMRLAENQDQPLSADLSQRISNAGRFLYQIQDDQNGSVPNYGQNDGALVLPLNNCDSPDFRPVLQATQFLTTGKRCYSPGPWDEDLLWLFGPESLDSPIETNPRVDFQARQGGCYTMRTSDTLLFARCPAFRHRPAHADLLHVDLWWRGQNIALDAGTFSYNLDSSSGDPLSKTGAHNTVTIDQCDQMDRVGRFLWLPWAKAEAHRLQKSDEGNLTYLELTHDGYQRLDAPAFHTRAVLRVQNSWLIIDRLTSSAEHEYRLHWLLMDAPIVNQGETNLTLDTSDGPYYMQAGSSAEEQSSSIVRADDASLRGWRAPYYNRLEPALSLELRTRAVNTVFWTIFGPESCEVVHSDDALHFQTVDWSAHVRLNISEVEPLVSSITLSGLLRDKMEID